MTDIPESSRRLRENARRLDPHTPYDLLTGERLTDPVQLGRFYHVSTDPPSTFDDHAEGYRSTMSFDDTTSQTDESVEANEPDFSDPTVSDAPSEDVDPAELPPEQRDNTDGKAELEGSQVGAVPADFAAGTDPRPPLVGPAVEATDDGVEAKPDYDLDGDFDDVEHKAQEVQEVAADSARGAADERRKMAEAGYSGAHIDPISGGLVTTGGNPVPPVPGVGDPRTFSSDH